MTRLSRGLRALAVLIAVAAAIDPSLALMRRNRASIAVIDAGGGTATGAISKLLAESFDVHQGAIADAAATVVVDDRLPATPFVTSGALFAVMPPPATPRIDLEEVSAPAVSSSGSKIPVTVRARAAGLAGRSIVAELYVGSLAVDSVSSKVAGADERVGVTLALPPAGAGLANARVVVRDSANRSIIAERSVIVDIRDQRWRVLAVDPRPSWTSTFVRRAIEGDRRFDVASRVGTSKNVEVQSGAAPALTDTAALAAFDAIVIGAPDALGAAEVRSLERYARERGGSIVLLLDRAVAGPLSPLFGDLALNHVRRIERARTSGGAGSLVATEFAVPHGPSLSPLARVSIDGTEAPVVWSSPLGAGRIIINGALDAWKYRARENGGFAAFWSGAVAAAAAASPAPLTLSTDSLRVAPGEIFDVRAIVRDAQLSDPSRPSPPVELDGPPDVWPAAARGVFHASVKAPATPGIYEVALTGSSVQASNVPGFGAVLHYAVASADDRPLPQLLAAWTTSRGGTVITGDAARAASRIEAAVSAERSRVETHPMRSIWWLPIFVSLLGGEWWIRRRSGRR
jgi:hypothetical protein